MRLLHIGCLLVGVSVPALSETTNTASKIVLTNSAAFSSPASAIPLLRELVSGPSLPVEEPKTTLAPGVWAEGSGVRVTSSDVAVRFGRSMADAVAQGRTIPASQHNLARLRILENMIFMQLVSAQATEADRTRAATDSERFVKEIFDKASSREAILAELEKRGYTLDTFKADKVQEALVTAVIDREVKSLVKIPSADVRAYYDEDRSRWEKPEMVRAAHILVGTLDDKTGEPMTGAPAAEKEKLAKSLLERAQKGEDFAKLALEFSDDPGSNTRGGEYTFPKGQLAPEFEAAAFERKPGEIGDLVKTKFGWHILKVIERVPPRTMKFDEVESEIREMLINREMEVRIPEYSDLLRRRASVVIAEDAPKPYGT
jgi:parvulin-like peptidyl-prolyl isomerase